MKRLFAIGIGAVLLAGATACHLLPDAEPGSRVTSTWRWVSTTGGLTGHQTATPATTGSALTWQFRADSTVVMTLTTRTDPTRVDTVRYSVGTIRSIYSGQPARCLTLSRAGWRTPYVVQEAGRQLVLADNNYDGFTMTFEQDDRRAPGPL